MGAQAQAVYFAKPISPNQLDIGMAPKAMKTMRKASTKKSLTKTEIAQKIADATELKKSDCVKVINSLADVAAVEIKKTGKLVIPGVAMLKTRLKPATKAGKRE